MTAPPRHPITWHEGRSAEPHPARDHAGTTGAQHDGRSYHAGTTGTGTTGIHARDTRDTKSRIADHADQQPNGLAFSCRERAGRSLQNTNNLAREAVNCNAVLGGSSV
jgi:hypothetical protein